jgi:hypothetical protein
VYPKADFLRMDVLMLPSAYLDGLSTKAHYKVDRTQRDRNWPG